MTLTETQRKLVKRKILARTNWKDSEPRDCWIWPGSKDGRGYGLMTIGGKHERTHRLAYMAFIGDEIPTGAVVMHDCDNPSCCNPSHLRIGTQQENIQDAISKGRQTIGALGEAHSRSKLTRQKVQAIRQDKRRCTDIALRYGISKATVSNLKAGRGAWSWLKAA